MGVFWGVLLLLFCLFKAFGVCLGVVVFLGVFCFSFFLLCLFVVVFWGVLWGCCCCLFVCLFGGEGI